MRIVVPWGFYGWGNIGDEATLHGFARLMAHCGGSSRVWVGSRNPVHTSRVEPAFRYFDTSRRDVRGWMAKLRGTAHAFFGGTPIMDVLGEWPLSDVSAIVRGIDRWRVPLSFVGVGVEGLRRPESRAIVAGDIIPRVRHWSVRSERDRERLLEYGAPPQAVTVAADAAWLLEAASPEFGQRRLRQLGLDPGRPPIGVVVVNENGCFDAYPHMAEELAGALDCLAERMDAPILFLAGDVRPEAGFDTAAAHRLASRLARPERAVIAPRDYLAPRDMMSIVGCCRLLVTMRYHFCVFSALSRVPFIAITRADKIADLCWDTGWDAAVAPPAFDRADIVAHAERLLCDRDRIDARLADITATLRRRALGNVQAVDALRAGTSGRIDARQ